jgi:hypothetical protein
MPTASDLTLARELTVEQREEERVYKRKRDKLEAKEREEDMVGPKPVGREGMLEKKRAKREGDRAFRERGDEGLEVDESTLLGGGDSFRDQCVQVSIARLFSPPRYRNCRLSRRDMAKRRYEQKNEEKQNAMRERSTAFKEKEKVGSCATSSCHIIDSPFTQATMDMFQQLAKQRFG